jgi:hypothetical protein
MDVGLLLLFAGLVANHWVGFFMGSAVMALISAVERMVKPLPLAVYGAIILLGGVVFASYGAWQDEHNSRLAVEKVNASLQAQLDNQEPQFTLHLELAEIIPVPTVDGIVMWAFIVGIEVVNSGGPSICEYWNADLKTPKGTFPLIREAIPEGMPYLPIGKDKAIRYHRENNLLLNTAKQRIEHYAGANGVMAFAFPELPSDLLPLNIPGNEFSVTCKAPSGHSFSISIPAEKIKLVRQNYESPGPSVSPEPLPKSSRQKSLTPRQQLIR